MSDEEQTICPHDDVQVTVMVNHLTDVGAYMVDVEARCGKCHHPFEWLGLDRGLSFTKPMTNATGTELHAPMQPQGQPSRQSSVLGFRIKGGPL